jgi:hypothetical protein
MPLLGRPGQVQELAGSDKKKENLKKNCINLKLSYFLDPDRLETI